MLLNDNIEGRLIYSCVMFGNGVSQQWTQHYLKKNVCLHIATKNKSASTGRYYMHAYVIITVQTCGQNIRSVFLKPQKVLRMGKNR